MIPDEIYRGFAITVTRTNACNAAQWTGTGTTPDGQQSVTATSRDGYAARNALMACRGLVDRVLDGGQ